MLKKNKTLKNNTKNLLEQITNICFAFFLKYRIQKWNNFFKVVYFKIKETDEKLKKNLER